MASTILTLLLYNSYFINGNASWEIPRKTGDSLEGYWYLIGRDEGCFRDSDVIFIKNNKLYQVYNQNIEPTNFSIFAKQDQVRLISRETYNKFTEAISYDLGRSIEGGVEYTRVNGKIVKEIHLNSPMLKTCDNPSTKGMFLSLFRKVFEPRQDH